jgi:F-type H+-transporting ATPase subunit delta
LPPPGADIAAAHRIYAEALFGAAKDAGRLDEVHEELADFAHAVAETPELRAVLRNPQLDPSAKAGILSDLAGTEDQLFTNFLLVVAEKGRAGELEDIAREFERLIAREERRLTVELTTARELTDDEARGIVAQIEEAAGRKVEATRKVDPSILGGIVLQAGSYLADASVRGRLERLRQTLVRS